MIQRSISPTVNSRAPTSTFTFLELITLRPVSRRRGERWRKLYRSRLNAAKRILPPRGFHIIASSITKPLAPNLLLHVAACQTIQPSPGWRVPLHGDKVSGRSAQRTWSAPRSSIRATATYFSRFLRRITFCATISTWLARSIEPSQHRPATRLHALHEPWLISNRAATPLLPKQHLLRHASRWQNWWMKSRNTHKRSACLA